LPTCKADELATVFGPVEDFLFEDADAANALRYRNNSGGLHRETLSITEGGAVC
jgi:hypothetical protein